MLNYNINISNIFGKKKNKYILKYSIDEAS